MNDDAPAQPTHAIGRGRFVALVSLFGSIYFAQAFIEPTAGMLHQPMQSQLDDWRQSAAVIGRWMGILGLPWTLKPLFGLLTDFVPIFGYRRWIYLLLACGGTTVAFGSLYVTGFREDSIGQAFALLLLATAGVAFADVVIDGLAVEEGQPAGITGQLQSVQWGATSLATILAGALGGYLAQHSLLPAGFLLCAALAGGTFLASVFLVRERRRDAAHRPSGARGMVRGLIEALRSPLVVAVGGFLFLWNFNPFSSTVQQLYVTNEIGLSQQFYGLLISVYYGAGVPACLLYAVICRRVPLGWLVHLSIAMGALSTLAYWGLAGPNSAIAVTAVAGFAYMLGTVIQLDIAARIVPLQSAATLFALLMALSNTGISSGVFVGGQIYDHLAAQFGSRHLAFDILVAVGAACTAGCWLLVPWLKRCGLEWGRANQSAA